MEKSKVLNLLAFLCIVTGVLFKIQHWPGASISLIVGMFLLTIASLMSIAKNKEQGATDTLNYLFTFAQLAFIVTTTFIAMHWPGGSMMGMVSHVLMVLMPTFLLFQKDDSRMSNSFWTSYLILMFVTISIMANRTHHQHHEGETPQEHIEEVQPGQ